MAIRIYKNDIWLVKFPYMTKGNMYKIRPALILDFDFDNEEIIVQKITSKKWKYNKKLELDFLKGNSYLTNEIARIKDYNVLRKLGKYK